MNARWLIISLIAVSIPLVSSMELETLRSSPDEETPLFAKDRTPRKRQKKLSLKQRKLALFEAAKAGESDSVKSLLALGTPVGIKDSLGSTPLHCAAMEGHEEVVALFLEGRRDVGGLKKLFSFKAKEIRNKDGFSPLHLAASRGHLEVVVALYGYMLKTEKYFWIACFTNKRETAYELAVKNNERDVACFMLDTERGRIPFESLRRAWFFAIEDDHHDMIRLLSEKYYKPWKNASWTLGLFSSLQYAVFRGSLDTVSFFIAKGASPDDRGHKYKGDTSSLHLAANRKEKCAEYCEVLLKGVIVQETEYDILGWLAKKQKQGLPFSFNREAILAFLSNYFLVKIKSMCDAKVGTNLPCMVVSKMVVIYLPGSNEPTPLKTILDPGFIHMYFPKLIERWFAEELSSLDGTLGPGKEELF